MTFSLAFVVVIGLTLLGCACATAADKPRGATGDYVVLLHGSGRTAASMLRLQHALSRHGYRVINETYSPTRDGVAELSEHFLAPLLSRRIQDPRARVHFVTHSLGGIIVRDYLSRHDIPNLGRVVMLAPPNHGSEIIDFANEHPLLRAFFINGRGELGTQPDDLPNRLGPVSFECGIIAGDLSLNPFLSSFLPGPDDGKVSVASAQVDGMRDFLVMRASHTWIMWRKQTVVQVLAFLQSGHFSRRE